MTGAWCRVARVEVFEELTLSVGGRCESHRKSDHRLLVGIKRYRPPDRAVLRRSSGSETQLARPAPPPWRETA